MAGKKPIVGILKAVDELLDTNLIAKTPIPHGVTVKPSPTPKGPLGEHIVAAATVHNGKIYTGPNHFEMDIPDYDIDRDYTEESMGFLTNTGRFVNRKEAADIAHGSGQKSPNVPFKTQTYPEGSLISEDLGLTLSSNPLWKK